MTLLQLIWVFVEPGQQRHPGISIRPGPLGWIRIAGTAAAVYDRCFYLWQIVHSTTQPRRPHAGMSFNGCLHPAG